MHWYELGWYYACHPALGLCLRPQSAGLLGLTPLPFRLPLLRRVVCRTFSRCSVDEKRSAAFSTLRASLPFIPKEQLVQNAGAFCGSCHPDTRAPPSLKAAQICSRQICRTAALVLIQRPIQIKNPHKCGFILFGGPCWVRTSDQLIKSQLLYQLS